jgi:phosphoheptose isomerase
MNQPVKDAAEFFQLYKNEIGMALDRVDPIFLNVACRMILEHISAGNPIFSMGNGGSAAISDHLACDHGKCITYNTHMKNYVISLPSNGPLLTAIANDIGYEEVFAFQLQQQHSQKGLVIGISSSGSSPNIVRGFEAAKERGYNTIALVGFDGGKVKKQNLADCIIHVDAFNYGMVEDCHQMIMHTLSQTIRLLHGKGEFTL